MHRLILFLLILADQNTLGQIVDSAFDPEILTKGQITDIATQPDGKIIVSGRFITYHDVPVRNLVRLNLNGSIDNSFQPGSGPEGGLIYDIRIQQDGKIILFGHFERFSGYPIKKIVRLNPDGSLDETFDFDATLVDNSSKFIRHLIFLPGEKMLAARYLHPNTDLIKINPDGSIDNSFNTSVRGAIYDMKVIVDNKILIVGNFDECNGIPVKNIALLDSNGQLVEAFGSGADYAISRIAKQSNGKIILQGYFLMFDGHNVKNMLRLNTDLTVDHTFTGVQSGFITNVSIDKNDNIFVGIISPTKKIEKLNADGVLISSYPTNALYKLLIQEDQNILCFEESELIRLSNNLNVDETFQSLDGARASGTIQHATRQSDGKIVMVGNFVSFNNAKVNTILRLNHDLTVDETFLSSGFTKPSPQSVVFGFIDCQSDDKLLISGIFESYNDSFVNSDLIRVEKDGDLDNTFVSHPAYSRTGSALFSDFIYIRSSTAPFLVRLFPSGLTDQTFQPTINNEVLYCFIQSDGKVLISGKFTEINGKAVPPLVRLNEDGSIDESFLFEGSSDYQINSFFIHPLGRIILEGQFKTTSSQNFKSFIALTMDGAFDNNFQAPDNSVVYSSGRHFLLKDNTILIQTPSGLERLFQTGKLDNEFKAIPQNGFQVRSALPLAPNRFVYFGSLPNGGLKMVHVFVTPANEPPAAPDNVHIEPNSEGFPVITWNDNSVYEDNFNIERTNSEGEFILINTKPKNMTHHEDRTAKPSTYYRYRISATNMFGTSYSTDVAFSTNIITGIEGTRGNEIIYPNPSTGIIYVELKEENDCLIEIMTSKGQTIRKIQASNNLITLDISNEAPGIYGLKIITREKIKMHKLFKY